MDPCQLYLATGDFICHKLRIADDERNLDLDSTAAALAAHGDMVVGFKVRATHTGDDTHSPFLSGAQQVAGDKPVMVHLGRFPHTPTITNEALLTTLRAGDVITHAFRAGGGQLDPETGAVTPEFADAVDRGVRLDVGPLGHRLPLPHRPPPVRRRPPARTRSRPTSTSTTSTNPVGSLPKTMSKIWALGVDLPAVVAMATPGRPTSIGRQDELGSLAVGRAAEVTRAAHRGRPGRAVRRPRDASPPTASSCPWAACGRGAGCRSTPWCRRDAPTLGRVARLAGARSMRPDEGSVGRGLAGAAARPPGP